MTKKIYITKRVEKELPNELITYLFLMIGDVKKAGLPIDYLQVFDLNPLQNGRIEIVHRQRNSEYERKVLYRVPKNYKLSKETIFVIYDSQAITMMFAGER